MSEGQVPKVNRSPAEKTSAGSYGSTAVRRSADLAAELRSFDVDCQSADIRENPVSASCSLRIDQEIGMSMTGIKVQRS